MRKREELTNPESCMSKAHENEMTFVLLGRDACAAETIRYWAFRRIMVGKNNLTDPQIVEALNCARQIDAEHAAERERNVWRDPNKQVEIPRVALCKECGKPTVMACADCTIDAGSPVHICGDCQTKHAAVCGGKAHHV